MSIAYRVKADAYQKDGKEELLLEHFEARSDAEKFFADLQNPETSPLASVPFGSLSLSMEEFYNGTWTTVSKKLVTR